MVAEVTRTAAHGVLWDNDLATRLTTAMVGNSNQIQSLISGLSLEEDDVIAEGVAYAYGDWHEYEPIHKGQKIRPSTFIQQRANTGIYNYLRKEGSQSRRVKDLGGELHKADKDRDLCDWLKDVYEAAKRLYMARKRSNQGRTYPLPAVVAIASLMQRESLSCRGCARVLAGRSDLQAVLKIKQVPDYSTISRAAILVKRITGFHLATDGAINGGEVATANH